MCCMPRVWERGCLGGARFGSLLGQSRMGQQSDSGYSGVQTLVDGSLSKISRFLIPKFETPMFLTLPVAGNF